MTSQQQRIITPAELEAALTAAGQSHDKLAGIAAFLRDVEGYPEVVEVFLNPTLRQVIVVTEDARTDAGEVETYLVETMTADAFCERYELTNDFGREYRTWVEHGEGARHTSGCPDIPDLSVPAARFMREVDALFGRPQPPATEYTPAQVMVTTLEELVENTPASAEERPVTVLTITDPETGIRYPVDLAPEHVQVVSEALARVLHAANATQEQDADRRG